MDDLIIFIAVDDLSCDVIKTVHKSEDMNLGSMKGDESFSWFCVNLTTGSVFRLS